MASFVWNMRISKIKNKTWLVTHTYIQHNTVNNIFNCPLYLPIQGTVGIQLIMFNSFQAFLCVSYLFLVVEVHLAVSHLPPQPVHFLAELQLVLPLIWCFIKLFGQVEVLAVQLSILLTQLCKLLLQVSDHLRQNKQCYTDREIASTIPPLWYLFSM